MGAKSGGKTILGKVASRLCRYPAGQKFCRNHSSLACFRDKHVFAFFAEIQDGHQKWWENDFWEMSPVKSIYTLWIKNLVEIAVSSSIIEINGFLRFTQKFKMAAKTGEKTIFGENCQYKFVEIALSHTVSEINTFLCFMQKFKMATKDGGKPLFGKSCLLTLSMPIDSLCQFCSNYSI